VLTIKGNYPAGLLLAALAFTACSKHSTPPSPTHPAPPSLSITSFSPTNGPDSTKVTITGTAFSSTIADDSVYFNGKPAVVTSANDSVLVAIVPMLAGTGDVSVKVNGTTTTGSIFTYDTTYTTVVVAPNIVDPIYIAADDSGNLFVSSDAEGSVIKITPAGSISTFISFRDSLGGPGGPVGLAFDGNGNLVVAVNYATSGYAAFYRVNSSGTPTIIGTDTPTVSGIALDQNGNIYAANFTNQRIDKITPQGAVSQFATGLYYAISGVAVGSDGSVYAATTPNPVDPTRGEVYKFNSAGTGGVYASGLSFGTQDGIAIDKNNNLYVTCYNEESVTQSVVEIFPNGTTKTLTTNILIPADVVLDNNGNIYVANDLEASVSVYGNILKLIPR
jgi:sugar lactone lactonase YvrE